MCGIFCFTSVKDYSQKELHEILSSLNHRGPDHSHTTSIHLNDTTLNFLVTQLVIVGNELFPVTMTFSSGSFTGSTGNLIGNIEIYNYKEIYNLYLRNNFEWKNNYSDAHVILPLLQHLSQTTNSLNEILLELFTLLQGDYAIALILANRYLLLARDHVGIRPLYYVYNDTQNFAFSSEVASLTTAGFPIDDVQTVKPGTYTLLDLQKLPDTITWAEMENNLSNLSEERLSRALISREAINNTTKVLFNKLQSSVARRIPSNTFALFLSGGIDSSVLLGLILYLKQDRNLEIISVGFEESSDLVHAKELCNILNVPLHEVIITKSYIEEALPVIVNVLASRKPDISVIDVSIALPLFFASKKAHELGCKVAITGQGADELFIGYKKYYEPVLVENKTQLLEKVNEDLQLIALQNLERDDLITMHFSVEIRFPYLDMELINWVLKQPIDTIYSGIEQSRKELLRKVAAKLKLPNFIVEREKKASQYGSSVMKNLRQMAKPYRTIKEYLESLKSNE